MHGDMGGQWQCFRYTSESFVSPVFAEDHLTCAQRFKSRAYRTTRQAVQQYAKDMAFLRKELRQATEEE